MGLEPTDVKSKRVFESNGGSLYRKILTEELKYWGRWGSDEGTRRVYHREIEAAGGAQAEERWEDIKQVERGSSLTGRRKIKKIKQRQTVEWIPG